MSIMQKFLALPKKVVDTVRYYAENSFYNESVVERVECDGKKYRVFVGNFIGYGGKDCTGVVIKDSGNNELFNGVLDRNKLLKKS